MHRLQTKDRQIRTRPETLQYLENAIGQDRPIHFGGRDAEKTGRDYREEAEPRGERERTDRIVAGPGEEAQTQPQNAT